MKVWAKQENVKTDALCKYILVNLNSSPPMLVNLMGRYIILRKDTSTDRLQRNKLQTNSNYLGKLVYVIVIGF